MRGNKNTKGWFYCGQLNDQMVYYCPPYISLYCHSSMGFPWVHPNLHLLAVCASNELSWFDPMDTFWGSPILFANMSNFCSLGCSLFRAFLSFRRKLQLTEWANIGSQGEKRSICLAQLCTGPGLLVKELKGKWAHPSDFICLVKLCTDLGLE